MRVTLVDPYAKHGILKTEYCEGSRMIAAMIESTFSIEIGGVKPSSRFIPKFVSHVVTDCAPETSEPRNARWRSVGN